MVTLQADDGHTDPQAFRTRAIAVLTGEDVFMKGRRVARLAILLAVTVGLLLVSTPGLSASAAGPESPNGDRPPSDVPNPFAASLIPRARASAPPDRPTGAAAHQPEFLADVGSRTFRIQVGSVVTRGVPADGHCTFPEPFAVRVQAHGDTRPPGIRLTVDDRCQVVVTSLSESRPIRPNDGESVVPGPVPGPRRPGGPSPSNHGGAR